MVELDAAKGRIAVRTTEGKINRLQLDPNAKGQLQNIRQGDKVVLTLAIQAKAIEPRKEERAGEDHGGAKGDDVQNGVGNLSGKVVRFDHQARFIEIQTHDGEVNRIELDKEAEGQLKNIKTGDQVNITLTIEATSVQPKG